MPLHKVGAQLVGCGTQDESWTERVAGMTIPDGVSTLGKIIKTVAGEIKN